MVTTRSRTAQPQSSRPSSPHQAPNPPDAGPVVSERTSYDRLELLRAYVRPAAMLDRLVHAARNPEVFEELRAAFSHQLPSDQQLLQRLFASTSAQDSVSYERHATPVPPSVEPLSPLTPASELPNVDPELDTTILWSSGALNASQSSPGTVDTSSADELPRGHPEAAAELRFSSSPSLGVTSDRELEAITELATHPGTMFDSGIFQTKPLNGSVDSSQLGPILDEQDLSRAQDLEQGHPGSQEQPPSSEQSFSSPEQSPSYYRGQFSPYSPERSPSYRPEQPPPYSREQSHPYAPEPGHDSSSEQDLTNSLAQNLADSQVPADPLQVPADSPAQDPTDWESTLSTLVHGRSANDASTVPGLLTPNDSPSKVSHSAAENLGSPPDLPRLAAMSAADFAAMAFEQVRRFRLPEDTRETYKDLYSRLTAVRQAVHRSDGSQLLSLVDSALAQRHRSTICYALTSIDLYRWHTSEVGRLVKHNKRKAAAEQVTSRLLRSEGTTDARPSGEQRKQVNTHLARGKKWARLVDELGFGILLMRAWDLGKTSEPALETLLDHLRQSSDKKFVLALLDEQMDSLQGTGKTDPDNLRHRLEAQGLIDKSQPLDMAHAVATLQNEMRSVCGEGRFSIQGTTLELDIESLDRLPATEWFNDQLILACLHLAQKQSHIRVGLSIPLHREVAPYSLVTKPLEKAARQMQDWKRDTPEDVLVCLFPLFQHNNHFSLLEIDLREGCVRHYDSLAGRQDDVQVDVQAACAEQFPELRFIQEATQTQTDDSSCGPLVVSSARRRMLNRPLPTGHLTVGEAAGLRADALRLIGEAWSSGALIPAEESSSKKRRAKGLGGDNRGKRCKRGSERVGQPLG